MEVEADYTPLDHARRAWWNARQKADVVRVAAWPPPEGGRRRFAPARRRLGGRVPRAEATRGTPPPPSGAPKLSTHAALAVAFAFAVGAFARRSAESKSAAAAGSPTCAARAGGADPTPLPASSP